ncbi:hypothetical protein G3J71_002023 [Salmonella enterica]|nr:hypothetical protein [Salmonella enterica]ECY5830218.1 hypothetical protein [Salmonella enterica subsp. enterica serovar Give]EDX5202686.1 hypothetical protein [Salmonella enterica subsp. enterica serovar 4,[5],12:i:-]EBC7328765.1 hypothetical protein [Salmonella enterica]EBC7417767.1 hypothetical protein [Salmonella enterica]
MTTLDPRQLWRRTARTGKPDACKTMHLLHARLKNGKSWSNFGCMSCTHLPDLNNRKVIERYALLYTAFC